ncbi:onanonoxo-7-onima-8-eninoihtemlysoneda [Laetiporus sulphureus 93-53]|uniref:Onanonoxo-7-onima-8-eninoihtemlysoneda n=1 Tax=Laetiporus sulphureus 93-53 TaxID=1314785 RepID=A0A165E0S4_9APHY|nr:onanonoxo-7-onima-8-eninoihtemlysoneda [Laetiporus sulphureus 93-53]KZT06024.1 onanonoxo-7-onima-8-eninoihtemlysoneda [Laetiporus sulphureus 93-53]
MSSLFKNLRIHQVFGANTDVGKTILTTALVRASASKDVPVHYLKPVSTGPMQDADDRHIECFAGPYRDNVHTACLFRFDEPVSPHLSVLLAGQKRNREVTAPTDAEFVTAVAQHIEKSAFRFPGPAHMYVETAGGVHSPTLSGTTQVDAYRPLFLPTILIGDSQLGGISTTISSYESLLLRGYIIDLVLLFHDAYYRNYEYLIPYFAERGIRVLSLDLPHKRLPDENEEQKAMKGYYERLAPELKKEGNIYDAVDHLDDCHARRLTELESMPRRSLDTFWWPFVQHGLVPSEADVNVIDSASQDFFSIYNGKRAPSPFATSASPTSSGPTSLLEPQFDSSASWWTQALGHAHPSLTTAAARAAGRYGHVMFPQATHAPALRLGETLVHRGPGAGWASRAFFSDDGSTGMEVALKMALRAYAVRHAGEMGGRRRKDLGILGMRESYHGDTIGAMDACEEGVYTCEWHEAKGFWLDAPTVSNVKGRILVTLPSAIIKTVEGTDAADMTIGSLKEAYDVKTRLHTPLADIYRRFIDRTLTNLRSNGGPTLAALALEPLVMGAGGMLFVDPLFQRVLIDTVRGADPRHAPGEWSGLPVIFDEVFAGLYRLGVRSAGPLLGVHPDISVHAKILTGGLVPLSVTLASESIFRAFQSESKLDALLHGHSYTAYPVGCEVANETLKIVEKMAEGEAWDASRARWGAATSGAEKAKQASAWSFWDPAFVDKLARLEVVGEVTTLGTVLAFKIQDDVDGYRSNSAQKLLESMRLGMASEQTSAAPGGAPFGINYRTLGNVAYFMLSLNTSEAVIHAVQDRILQTLQKKPSAL